MREDRFHEIDSIMQSVSLSDEVTLISRGAGVEVFCDDPLVPADQSNAAYSAASAFFGLTKISKGISINLKKSIPAAAGLAGGSSNAAAVLIGLDKLYNTRLSRDQLSSLGAQVGSDVPFCLTGGRCRVRGRGELVESLPILPKTWFVIVVPDLRLQTKWAYEEYDRWKMKTTGGTKGTGSQGPMHNDFEEAISSKFTEIRDIKDKLLGAGAVSASMSGSGPSVWGMSSEEAGAGKIAGEMKSKYSRVFVASNVNYGVKVI